MTFDIWFQNNSKKWQHAGNHTLCPFGPGNPGTPGPPRLPCNMKKFISSFFADSD